MPLNALNGNNGASKKCLCLYPDIITDKTFWKSHKDSKNFNVVSFKDFREPIAKTRKLKKFLKRNQISSVEFQNCSNVGSKVFRAFKHLTNSLQYLNLTTYVDKFDHIKALKHVAFTNNVIVMVAVNAANLKKLLLKNKRFIIRENTEKPKSIRPNQISDSIDYRRIKMERERQLMEQRKAFTESRHVLNRKNLDHSSDSNSDSDEEEEEERQQHQKYIRGMRQNERQRPKYDLSDSSSSSDSSTDSDSDSYSDSHSDDSNDSDTMEKRYYSQYGCPKGRSCDLRRK